MYRKLNPKWRYPLTLLAVYGVFWLALAIDPVFRQDWLLENAIVLVALQPLKAMDYTVASTYRQLCNDDFCSVPEFTGVAVRMGKRPPEVVLGTLHGDAVAAAPASGWRESPSATARCRRCGRWTWPWRAARS
mgnify:CR=1 FL=1